MRLTHEQIKTFDEQGYVFFPNCFSEEEVAVLRRRLTDSPRQARLLEERNITTRKRTPTSQRPRMRGT